MAQLITVSQDIPRFESRSGRMNCFGSESRRFALVDPRSVREDRARFRRDSVPMLDCANSFYCPTGRWPVRGWILMARGEYDLLNKYSTALRLDIGDTTSSTNVSPLKNLSIVQAQCVTRGLATDLAAIYLVEITDNRGILHNKWFQFPLTKAYNIRVPGYPETFYLSSMKDYDQPNPSAGSKTTWTWSTMLQDIWETMPLLGAWPGLPTPVPLGTPEGFWFPGVPAWTALNDVLDYLGLTVACNLALAAPYTIVRRGATSATFNTLTTRYLTNIEDDLEWIDAGAGRVPKVVKVLFRRRNTIYGSEETVAYRNDVMAKQWSMDAYYTVSVNAPSGFFEKAAGTHFIWSDFTVRYDDSSDDVDADVTTATAIAKERVSQYFDRIYNQTIGAMTRTYAGPLPFVTGSQVDGICYYQDYRNDDRYGGWRTKIVRGQDPPFPEIYSAV